MKRVLLLGGKVNILAIVAGILMLYILYTGEPWWILTAVGDNPTFGAEIAPYKIVIEIMDRPVDIPLINYMVLSGYITYLLIGVVSIIGGLTAKYGWSEKLLGYRALIMIVATIGSLYLGLFAVENMIGIQLPFIGMDTILFQYPYQGETINIFTVVSSGFTDTFYLALVAAILVTIGKILVRKSYEV